MGKSWPLQRAHPFGAKTKLMIRISDRNGSAIGVSSQRLAENQLAGVGQLVLFPGGPVPMNAAAVAGASAYAFVVNEPELLPWMKFSAVVRLAPPAYPGRLNTWPEAV